MKRITLAWMVTLLAAMPAHAGDDYSGLQMQMAACQTSDQCIVVEQACDGWIAINKNSQEGYNLLLTERRKLIECAGQKTPRPTTAKCNNNFCEAR